MVIEALSISDVSSYQGQFENGIANGIATIKFAAGAKQYSKEVEQFEGVVCNGRMNGIGKLTFSDGTVLEGNWVNN